MAKLSGKCCLIGWSMCCVPFLGLVIFLAIAMTRGFGSYPPSIEAVVFSNDPSTGRVAGIEEQWNKGIHPIPLQGWVGSVNPRSRVFIQDDVDDIESRTFFDQKYKSQPDTLYFMESAGYILLNSEPWNSFTLIDIEDGSTRTGPKGVQGAVPSPDGSVIVAFDQSRGTWERPSYAVTFFDSATLQPISQPDRIDLERPRAHNLVSYWEDNETFSLSAAGFDLPIGFTYDTDDYEGVESVNTIIPTLTWTVDGQTIFHNNTSTTTPSCLPLITSSTKYRDDGGVVFENYTTQELEVITPGMPFYQCQNYSVGTWYLCILEDCVESS